MSAQARAQKLTEALIALDPRWSTSTERHPLNGDPMLRLTFDGEPGPLMRYEAIDVPEFIAEVMTVRAQSASAERARVRRRARRAPAAP